MAASRLAGLRAPFAAARGRAASRRRTVAAAAPRGALLLALLLASGSGVPAAAGEAPSPSPPQPAVPASPGPGPWAPDAGLAPPFDALLRGGDGAGRHGVLVLREDTVASRRVLEEAGIALLVRRAPRVYEAFVPGTVPDASALRLGRAVARAAAVPADAKIDPRLPTSLALAAEPVEVLVQVHRDVLDGEKQLRRVVPDAGLERFGWRSFRLRALPAQVAALAELDAVRRIQRGPVPFVPLNDRVRAAIGTEALQATGLDGEGVRIAVVDSGIDADHPAFLDDDGSSRVYGSGNPAGAFHGTHVASIAAGGPGEHPELRGHAPAAAVGDFTPSGPGDAPTWAELVTEMLIEGASDLSNHSYIQSRDGLYDAQAADVDETIRGGGPEAPIPRRPQVWAAGNNKDFIQPDTLMMRVDCQTPDLPDDCTCKTASGTHAVGSAECDAHPEDAVCECRSGRQVQFFSVFTSAKNSISVGSVEKVQLANGGTDWRVHRFSAMGPTLDGRIKPDLVAPGCHADGGIHAAVPESQGSYARWCGSSMAAPVVSGTLALVLQAHREAGGAPSPAPATQKALLVQTAQDLTCEPSFGDPPGDPPGCSECRTDGRVRYGPGPDFATGFGLVDPEAAVALARRPEQLFEGVLATDGESRLRCVEVSGAGETLRVTLAWDDPPGAEPDWAFTTDAQPVPPALQNDLDLTLVGPDGDVVRPLVPRPYLPGSACPHATKAACAAWRVGCLTKPFSSPGACPQAGPDPLPTLPGDACTAGTPHPHTDPEVLGPAVEAEDRLNNVERAEVGSATAGTWKVRVRAHRLLTANGANGPQPFSLASSHALRPCAPEPDTLQDGPPGQIPQPAKPSPAP